MADYKVTDTELTSIANAIRTKGGTQAQLEFPTGFVSAVQAIPTGGGGGDDTPLSIIGIAGIVGNKELTALNQLSFTITGKQGMYACILLVSRLAPNNYDGCDVLYSSYRSINNDEYRLYVTLLKKEITSNSETITIAFPSGNRCGGVCFVVNKNYSKEVINETNDTRATVGLSGINVFVGVSGTTLTLYGYNPQNGVNYLFPTDVPDTANNTNSRFIFGYYNGLSQTSLTIGGTSSNTSAGYFVCLRIVETE